MVEVFKTNVEDSVQAKRIINRIHNTFRNYTANFDLEDCDNILRIKCLDGSIEPQSIINLINEFGFDAAILPDKIVTTKRMEYI